MLTIDFWHVLDVSKLQTVVGQIFKESMHRLLISFRLTPLTIWNWFVNFLTVFTLKNLVFNLHRICFGGLDWSSCIVSGAYQLHVFCFPSGTYVNRNTRNRYFHYSRCRLWQVYIGQQASREISWLVAFHKSLCNWIIHRTLNLRKNTKSSAKGLKEGG